MCSHVFVHTTWNKVCTECGLLQRILLLDTYNVFSAPLMRGYNRTQRFRVKVDKLLGIHNGPKATDPIWKYLNDKKIFLNTPFDIRQTIQQSKLKLKHYDAIRIFSDTFTTFKIDTGTPIKIKETLMNRFNSLYYDWVKSMLRYFLTHMKSPLLVYLKPKTSRKRNIKYIQKLTQSQKNYEIQRYGLSKIHSQNV